ncbi:MAG TPA: DMT family transporter [Steroidobacteraceae bacterium]|jgi:transporter family-2 protein|nr:DMT family transporter [Steroidobacteraceae bacterium]
MQLMPYVVTFLAGVLLTVQVGLNSTLGRAVGNVRFAILMNFLVGSVGLLIYFAAAGGGLPSRSGLAAAPAWAWFGGLLGACYVAVATLVGPRIGAAALLALTVLGQLLASLLVDQFGWLGFPLQPISLTKLAGAALLLGGVGLIVR